MEELHKGVYWIKLAKFGVIWRGIVKKIMNLKSRKLYISNVSNEVLKTRGRTAWYKREFHSASPWFIATTFLRLHFLATDIADSVATVRLVIVCVVKCRPCEYRGQSRLELQSTWRLVTQTKLFLTLAYTIMPISVHRSVTLQFQNMVP